MCHAYWKSEIYMAGLLESEGKKDVYRLVGDFNAEIGYLFMSVSILGTDKAALSI